MYNSVIRNDEKKAKIRSKRLASDFKSEIRNISVRSDFESCGTITFKSRSSDGSVKVIKTTRDTDYDTRHNSDRYTDNFICRIINCSSLKDCAEVNRNTIFVVS